MHLSPPKPVWYTLVVKSPDSGERSLLSLRSATPFSAIHVGEELAMGVFEGEVADGKLSAAGPLRVTRVRHLLADYAGLLEDRVIVFTEKVPEG